MNLALLSFYTPEFQPLADVTLPDKEEYCKRFGYTHIVSHFPYGNPANYYAFQRLQCARDLLFKSDKYDFDAIWVLNIHASIMNLTKNVADFIDNEHDFFITKDCNGINGGSFIVKDTHWAKNWLDFLLSKEDIHKNHCWYEQKLIIDNWERPEFKDKIKILPQNTINSYMHELYDISTDREGQLQKGDLVLHIPGKPLRTDGKSLCQARIDVFNSDFVKNNVIR